MTSIKQTRGPRGWIGVLEAEPFLAPELQRQFAGEGIGVRSFRLIGDLSDLDGPRVCVLEIESGGEAVLPFLQKVRHEGETACIIQAPHVPLSDTEWLLREAGAAGVIDSFVRGDELAAMCRKLLNSRTYREHHHEDHV